MTRGVPEPEFRERGYAAPLRLLEPEECRHVLARLRGERCQAPPDWIKGWAAVSPAHYALATDDRLLDLVTALLGEDVLLWGCRLIVRRPGQTHPWHSDVESSSPSGGTASAWVGLAGTSAASSLKVVPFSHRFGVTLQEVMSERGNDRTSVTDADVEAWARERDGRSGVVTVAATDGEALVFDGRLWHGSHNVSRRSTRYALLLQYATPRTPIRIPRFGDRQWPYTSLRSPRPACIIASGRDVHGVNRVVPGPVSDGGLPALSSRIDPVRLPLEQDPAVGWKPHGLFRGSTADIRRLSCHVSVLDPGRQPHPPHRHDEEELLIVLDGESELVLEAPEGAGETARRRAERGSFAYYPAGFAHTIANVSAAPVTYLMLKWVTDRQDEGEILGHRLVSFPEAFAGMRHDGPNGFSTERVLDGPTRYLRHLHAHLTTLQPGGGYPPHADAYDVAIVVLEGTVETLGERARPHDLVFYAAGEPHGMRNVGDAPAVYVVFELRGRHTSRGRKPPPPLSRRLLRLARDPRRLGPALRDTLSSLRGPR